MSILIKGMEMPTGKMKNIIILSDGPVVQFSGYGNPKPLGTAVPVPPHGALMDRDAFFAVCPELVDGYKRITDDLVIIPAEEGET